MARYVYANQSVVVTVGGFPVTVRAGSKWEAGDDAVREFPQFFDSPIEEASATPGQRRNR